MLTFYVLETPTGKALRSIPEGHLPPIFPLSEANQGYKLHFVAAIRRRRVGLPFWGLGRVSYPS